MSPPSSTLCGYSWPVDSAIIGGTEVIPKLRISSLDKGKDVLCDHSGVSHILGTIVPRHSC